MKDKFLVSLKNEPLCVFVIRKLYFYFLKVHKTVDRRLKLEVLKYIAVLYRGDTGVRVKQSWNTIKPFTAHSNDLKHIVLVIRLFNVYMMQSLRVIQVL